MKKSPLREKFLKQLAEKAKLANCFIYNPAKPVSEVTKCLEVGERLYQGSNITLPHTGWAANERQVWLDFYCVTTSKTEQHAAENRERFQKLYLHKVEIEKAFGENLIWDFEPTRVKQSVISLALISATETNTTLWGEIQDDLVNRMSRLGKVIKPFLRPMYPVKQ
jgi:hypothetical protein